MHEGDVRRAWECRAGATRGNGESRRRWRAAWPASSCAMAHRRGPLPVAPMPRIPPPRAPRRNAPCMAAPDELAGPVVTRQVRQSPDERVTAPGRNAAHCPGRSLQPQRCFASRCAGRAYGAPLTLEPLPAQRPVNTGQAQGPARLARGEPLRHCSGWWTGQYFEM
jgi:hypothetical protein